MASRIVLGIDPGLNTTGYGLIERSGGSIALVEAGTIRSRADDILSDRLNELYEGLTEVLVCHRPALMGLEEVYSHYRHPATAITMAHARGVLVLAARRVGVPVMPLPATRIKKLVTGSGRASKQQVSGMIRQLLGIGEEIRSLDVTDALAAALAAMEMEGYA